MTLNAQSVLGKSLDDVTHLQKRHRVVFIVMFIAVLICIFWLGHVSGTHPLDIQKLVLASMFFVLVSTFYVATAFASLQLRMFKKVLRAIELATVSETREVKP
jgi:hypothetical protein